jgi:hypothetical protein
MMVRRATKGQRQKRTSFLARPDLLATQVRGDSPVTLVHLAKTASLATPARRDGQARRDPQVLPAYQGRPDRLENLVHLVCTSQHPLVCIAGTPGTCVCQETEVIVQDTQANYRSNPAPVQSYGNTAPVPAYGAQAPPVYSPALAPQAYGAQAPSAYSPPAKAGGYKSAALTLRSADERMQYGDESAPTSIAYKHATFMPPTDKVHESNTGRIPNGVVVINDADVDRLNEQTSAKSALDISMYGRRL